MVEQPIALAGLDELPLGAGHGLVGLLRFEAQRLVFFRDVAGALGLDGELVLKVGDNRLLVLHVQAQVLDEAVLLADFRLGLAQLRDCRVEIIHRPGMDTAEIPQLPAQGLGGLGLLPEHRLGLEEPRLELWIVPNQFGHRLVQEGKILLEAAKLLQPVNHVGEADADQLVLLTDGIEHAVGPDDDWLGLFRHSGSRNGRGDSRSTALRRRQKRRLGLIGPFAKTIPERRPSRRYDAGPYALKFTLS